MHPQNWQPRSRTTRTMLSLIGDPHSEHRVAVCQVARRSSHVYYDVPTRVIDATRRRFESVRLLPQANVGGKVGEHGPASGAGRSVSDHDEAGSCAGDCYVYQV